MERELKVLGHREKDWERAGDYLQHCYSRIWATFCSSPFSIIWSKRIWVTYLWWVAAFSIHQMVWLIVVKKVDVIG